MNRSRRRMPGVGVTSVLMVFMILCLVTFACLALSSAKADLRYSQQTAQRAKAYYEAELRANQKLKDSDGETCFTEEVDEMTLLEVELRVSDSVEADGKPYRIERWQTVPREEWEPDRVIPVVQKQTEQSFENSMGR